MIIDGKDDDQTFTTALKISRLVNEGCHISAYFVDESKSEMLVSIVSMWSQQVQSQ